LRARPRPMSSACAQRGITVITSPSLPTCSSFRT
jgi:hypothetical protein